jgi:hypothetical protein
MAHLCRVCHKSGLSVTRRNPPLSESVRLNLWRVVASRMALSPRFRPGVLQDVAGTPCRMKSWPSRDGAILSPKQGARLFIRLGCCVQEILERVD